jgi:hypothetical protein
MYGSDQNVDRLVYYPGSTSGKLLTSLPDALHVTEAEWTQKISYVCSPEARAPESLKNPEKHQQSASVCKSARRNVAELSAEDCD